MTKSQTPSAPVLLTVAQVARLLGQSARWVYRQVSEGRLPARRFGRAVLFSGPELDRWLKGEGVGVRTITLDVPDWMTPEQLANQLTHIFQKAIEEQRRIGGGPGEAEANDAAT